MSTDEAMVLLTLAGVIVNAGVVLFAAIATVQARRAAREAKSIASDTEQARLDAVADQRTHEYRARFEDALTMHLRDLGQYVDALTAEYMRERGKHGMYGPLASLEAVSVRARGDDAKAMDAVRTTLGSAWIIEDLRAHRALMTELMGRIRKWGSGELPLAEFEEWARKERESALAWQVDHDAARGRARG